MSRPNHSKDARHPNSVYRSVVDINRPRRAKSTHRSSVPFIGRKHSRVAYTPPPVLRRTDLGQNQMPARKKGKNRRRYDVALPIPGAEVRLPSLPVIHFGWRILSGLMVISLAILVYLVLSQPAFKVEEVQVYGLHLVKQVDVETVVNISGESIFMVNPLEIRQDLQQAFPEMKAITVEVGLPASVAVTVLERQPVITWQQDGQTFWIDQDGVAFPPRGDAPGLVAIEGKLPTNETLDGKTPVQVLKPELVSAILQMNAQLPKKAKLIYDNDHGLGWIDRKGWKVYFGMDAVNIGMKLEVYQALVKRLTQEGIAPLFISVEYPHAPYYRVEP